MSAVRCFVALPMPACVTGPILDACEAIRDVDRGWRESKWVSAENLHITVRFFGDIQEAEIDALSRALGSALEGIPRFDLSLAAIRPVPAKRRAKMLWATFLDPDGQAARLAEAAERASLAFGVESDERPFRPHATLARSRRPHAISQQALQAAEQVLSSAPRSMSVHRATFLASKLTPRGPVYSEIQSWELPDGL